jgi:hypothetical protein
LKTGVLGQGRRDTKFMFLRISIQYPHVLLDNVWWRQGEVVKMKFRK